MEKINDEITFNIGGKDGEIVDLSQFDETSLIDGAITLMTPHIFIVLIIGILSYFIFGKTDKATFKIGGTALLFYVICYDLFSVFTSSHYFELTIYLNKFFEVTDKNFIFYLGAYGAIFTIFLNLILLGPFKKYIYYLKLKVDYKKIFILFFAYLTIITLYYILDTHINYGGHSGSAKHFQFNSTGMYIVYLTLIMIIPGIISYKIAFYDKVKKVNDII